MGKQQKSKKKTVVDDATEEGVKHTDLPEQIEELKCELEYWKDRYYQKKKDFEDLRCDFDNERDINEDLEKDLNKRDEIIKSLQYGIDGKIKMVNDLIRIRSENEENLSNLGNKLGVQTNVIKALKEKMKVREDDDHKVQKEVDGLYMEIKSLENENKEKVVALETLISENELLKCKLETLKVNEKEPQLEESMSMDKELSSSSKCEECEYVFDNQSKLDMHVRISHVKPSPKEILKARMKEMEVDLYAQKFELSTKLFHLKEMESLNRRCKCKGYCRIYHIKHNFQKSKCDEFLSILKNFTAPVISTSEV